MARLWAIDSDFADESPRMDPVPVAAWRSLAVVSDPPPPDTAKPKAAIAAATNVCYKNTPDGICGNDDFGTLSAWFVFRALGFFPVNASSGIYEIGTPMFDTASLDVGAGKQFTVTAQNVSRDNIYIQSARLNGSEFNRSYLTHEEILSGGKLEFVMGDSPNQNWASQPEDLPPAQGIGTFLHESDMPAGSR